MTRNGITWQRKRLRPETRGLHTAFSRGGGMPGSRKRSWKRNAGTPNTRPGRNGNGGQGGRRRRPRRSGRPGKRPGRCAWRGRKRGPGRRTAKRNLRHGRHRKGNRERIRGNAWDAERSSRGTRGNTALYGANTWYTRRNGNWPEKKNTGRITRGQGGNARYAARCWRPGRRNTVRRAAPGRRGTGGGGKRKAERKEMRGWRKHGEFGWWRMKT